MKKNVKNFLNYLDEEIQIKPELENCSPRQKIDGYFSKKEHKKSAIYVNVVPIKESCLALAVFTCECCNKIGGVEILYHNKETKKLAKTTLNQINNVVFDIPINLRNVKELNK
jgi:hypothetical protein